MKLKSILSMNSSNVLSIDELKSIVGGTWKYLCYCSYPGEINGKPQQIEVYKNHNVSKIECANICRTKCDEVPNNACTTNNLNVVFEEYGSSTGSGSGS